MVSRGWYRRCCRLFFLFVFFTTALDAAITTVPIELQLPHPQIKLKPEEVVRIVVEALADNDNPFVDAGIATTFNFASPANKANTGPLTKFSSMVKGPGYGLMIDHLSSEFSEIAYKDSKAYQIVKLIAKDGSEVVYAFRLTKQTDGEYQGMWMTDAVWKISKQSSF